MRLINKRVVFRIVAAILFVSLFLNACNTSTAQETILKTETPVHVVEKSTSTLIPQPTDTKAPIVTDAPQDTQKLNPEGIVIGYEGDPNQWREDDLKKACKELQIRCVEGKDIPDLVKQDVDAILSFSNQWKVLGDSMKIWSAIEESRIPVIILNADSDQGKAYNLSVDLISVRASMEWMFKEMVEREILFITILVITICTRPLLMMF